MKRKIFVIFIYLLFVFYFLIFIGFCSELDIGFGWPYIALKYNFSKRIASEIKWSAGEGINVYGGRGYWNFRYFDRSKLSKLFTGREAGYITFDSLDIIGAGYERSVFLGGEYFITKRLFLMFDISSTFIVLKSDEFKIDGIEFVCNLAVYYHLFGK
jgi:hypothetical protein